MGENGQYSLKIEEDNLPFLKRNLADFLTLSRGLTGLIILLLSLSGERVYLTVVILTLFGAVTDILDGRAARHYLGKNREGRMGKHDAEIDTFFLLCVMAYLALSGIIPLRALGLGWIGLVSAAVLISRRNLKILVISEVVTVIALLVIASIHDPRIFWFLIAPVLALGIVINRHRVIYLIFDYWPSLFSK